VEKLDRLLTTYLAGPVDDDAFNAKATELEAATAYVPEAIDAEGDAAAFRGELILAIFAWSQKAARIWRGSITIVRCQILDLICLNRQASNVTSVPAKTEPFDFFVKRLEVRKSRA